MNTYHKYPYIILRKHLSSAIAVAMFLGMLFGNNSKVQAQEEIDFGQYMLFHPTVNIVIKA